MGVFGNGFIKTKTDLCLKAYNDFINEYDNFSRLIEATDIINENGIQIIHEGFIDRIKELWGKFVAWVKRIWEKVKDGVKSIFNKIKASKQGAKVINVKNAKIYKLKNMDASGLDIDSNKLCIMMNVTLGDFREKVNNKDFISQTEASSNEYADKLIESIKSKAELVEEDFGDLNNSTVDNYIDKTNAISRSIETFVNSNFLPRMQKLKEAVEGLDVNDIIENINVHSKLPGFQTDSIKEKDTALSSAMAKICSADVTRCHKVLNVFLVTIESIMNSTVIKNRNVLKSYDNTQVEKLDVTTNNSTERIKNSFKPDTSAENQKVYSAEDKKRIYFDNMHKRYEELKKAGKEKEAKELLDRVMGDKNTKLVFK